jgi:hypothetical protein
MPIRGFNADTETKEILENLDIKKMEFSKTMNSIIQEWHVLKKQTQTPEGEPKLIVEDVN